MGSGAGEKKRGSSTPSIFSSSRAPRARAPGLGASWRQMWVDFTKLFSDSSHCSEVFSPDGRMLSFSCSFHKKQSKFQFHLECEGYRVRVLVFANVWFQFKKTFQSEMDKLMTCPHAV